jgi:lysophospholipase L1-like esterase
MISSSQLAKKIFPAASRRRERKAAGHALRGKTTHTLICFVALAALPYVVPGFSRYRVLLPASVLSLLERRDHQAMASAAPSTSDAVTSTSQRAAAERAPAETEIAAKPGEIEDPSGQALDHFFAALLKAETEGGRVRVCHYGDSPITNDGITATVRRRLQLRFGDAGHGFVLAAKPWGWYGHVGVMQEAGRGWQSDPMFISRGEHLYGLGGASFTASAPGVTASFGTVESGEVGRRVSSFNIYFLAQPGGGDFEIEVDGAPYARVVTASEEKRSGFYQVNVTEGHHTMTIKTIGNGEVRLFGVVLETGERGVSYDSLGVNGAFIGLLAHYLDEAHWAEQLRHRRPDLVILAYGANESEYENWPMDKYERDTKEVIRRLRAALPEASIMFAGPMDRGQRGAGGQIITRPTIPRLIEAQRRLAAETGCAFFDTFTAMGGDGTVARWHEARPRLMGGDFTHPTAQGAEIVGTLIYDALARAYDAYKARFLALHAQAQAGQ